MAESEIGSTEGNPGEPRGGGMGRGSPEAVAMIQVNTSKAWRGLGAARRKRVQKEMYRHSLLHPKGPGEELNSRVGIWPHVVQDLPSQTTRMDKQQLWEVGAESQGPAATHTHMSWEPGHRWSKIKATNGPESG